MRGLAYRKTQSVYAQGAFRAGKMVTGPGRRRPLVSPHTKRPSDRPPSTGHELVAALLFQNLNAQINALVTDEDAVRACD